VPVVVVMVVVVVVVVVAAAAVQQAAWPESRRCGRGWGGAVPCRGRTRCC
jgi:hypothetical protein